MFLDKYINVLNYFNQRRISNYTAKSGYQIFLQQ